MPSGVITSSPNTDFRDVLVFIPAWNEEKSIAAVIEDVRTNLPGAEILVVDDGSSDATARVSTLAGAIVLIHPMNLGVGATIRTAMIYAKYRNFDLIIQIDGDGQHPCSQINREFLDAMLSRDILIGNRFNANATVHMSGWREFFVKQIRLMLKIRHGLQVTDPTCGFRIFNSKARDVFAVEVSSEYLSDTVMSLITASSHHLILSEVDIQINPRSAGKPSQSSSGLVRAWFRVMLLGYIMPKPRVRE